MKRKRISNLFQKMFYSSKMSLEEAKEYLGQLGIKIDVLNLPDYSELKEVDNMIKLEAFYDIEFDKLRVSEIDKGFRITGNLYMQPRTSKKVIGQFIPGKTKKYEIAKTIQ